MATSKLLTIPIVASLCALSLSACSSIKTEAKYPSGRDRGLSTDENDIYGKKQSILGDGGFFGSKKKKSVDANNSGINSFLWRATLDTVSFMPLASADPFGGVILTDWYTDPNTPSERVKINAFILGRELKANGVRVRTFRQTNQNGAWIDAAVSEQTAHTLENTILTRARQLRISHLANEK